MDSQRFKTTHDDMLGQAGSALTGAAQWTPRQVRNTGIVMNHITSGDYFTMIFQFSHRRQLATALDSVHMHIIPVDSDNGEIAFNYAWGWFDTNDTIPDTLPNTGKTADIVLSTTDQYKLLIKTLLTGINYPTPADEGYSSILMVKFTAAAPTDGVNWWTATAGNELALAYVDAHYVVDRNGSVNEFNDI